MEVLPGDEPHTFERESMLIPESPTPREDAVPGRIPVPKRNRESIRVNVVASGRLADGPSRIEQLGAPAARGRGIARCLRRPPCPCRAISSTRS